MIRNYRLEAARCNNKVAAIKAIRSLTRLGLKEAKDFVEEAMVNPKEFSTDPTVTDGDVRYAINEIKASGCFITDLIDEFRPRAILKTKVLALEATAAGDYEYARRLLDVLIDVRKTEAQ